jgi:hypothetical protein
MYRCISLLSFFGQSASADIPVYPEGAFLHTLRRIRN